ncbi:MAG: nucleotidyltransferase family protein [Gemmatimonadetes bacterium]|nr:nucleotidyltransferase family protein [Gemmatimonadota bacterium]
MKLNLPNDQIAEFCRRWNVTEFALFGSVLRDDFRADSDVDVLVTFASPELTPSLFEHVDMQDELEAMFGRKVDVVNRHGVERSPNPFRNRAVLASARRIYPAEPPSGIPTECRRVDRDPGLLYDMLLAARDAGAFSAGTTEDEFERNELAIAAMSQRPGRTRPLGG